MFLMYSHVKNSKRGYHEATNSADGNLPYVYGDSILGGKI